MGTMTSEQVRKERIQTFGPELGKVYDRLWNEAAWIGVKWYEYKQLFYPNEFKEKKHIDIINDAASGFFGMLQRLMDEDIMLSLARITGPTQTASKKNLTIRMLPQLIETHMPERHELVRDEVAKTIEISKCLDDIRNRRLAHRDLNLAVEAKDHKPLQTVTMGQIEDTFKGAIKTLGKVADSEIVFDVGMNKGSHSLISVLEKGLSVKKMENL